MSHDADDDPDQAAILRRRNRLIALALSGAAIAASGCEPEPTPCLDPIVEDAGPPDDGGE